MFVWVALFGVSVWQFGVERIYSSSLFVNCWVLL